MTATEPDDEWPDDGLTNTAECGRCGKVRPVQLLADPFMSEVYGETTESTYWCRECYLDRREQV